MASIKLDLIKNLFVFVFIWYAPRKGLLLFTPVIESTLLPIFFLEVSPRSIIFIS